LDFNKRVLILEMHGTNIKEVYIIVYEILGYGPYIVISVGVCVCVAYLCVC